MRTVIPPAPSSRARTVTSPRYRTPSTNSVGVPRTPLRTPELKSASTRSSTNCVAGQTTFSGSPDLGRRSRAGPPAVSWGSSPENSRSCIGQNCPCTPAASAASAAARAKGWISASGKCRNTNTIRSPMLARTLAMTGTAARQYGHSKSPYSTRLCARRRARPPGGRRARWAGPACDRSVIAGLLVGIRDDRPVAITTLAERGELSRAARSFLRTEAGSAVLLLGGGRCRSAVDEPRGRLRGVLAHGAHARASAARSSGSTCGTG